MEIGDMVWCHRDTSGYPTAPRPGRSTGHFRMVGRTSWEIVLALPNGLAGGWVETLAGQRRMHIPPEYSARRCWSTPVAWVFEADPRAQPRLGVPDQDQGQAGRFLTMNLGSARDR